MVLIRGGYDPFVDRYCFFVGAALLYLSAKYAGFVVLILAHGGHNPFAEYIIFPFFIECCASLHFMLDIPKPFWYIGK